MSHLSELKNYVMRDHAQYDLTSMTPLIWRHASEESRCMDPRLRIS